MIHAPWKRFMPPWNRSWPPYEKTRSISLLWFMPPPMKVFMGPMKFRGLCCLVTLQAFIFVPENSPSCQMDVLSTESFFYFDIIFFIYRYRYYGYLTKIWFSFTDMRYFLILFLIMQKCGNPARIFICHQNQFYYQGSWHLWGRNNFFINMIYLKAWFDHYLRR